MSLETNILNFATRAATEDKSLRTLINGNLANLNSLTTTAKNNLVAAINEVAAAVSGASGINDATTSTTTSWSSSKTSTEIATAVAAVVDTAPGTLDTLNELAAALGDDANFSTTITNLINARVTGPASAVNNNLAVFNGTTGKLIADSGVALTNLALLTGAQTLAGVKTFSSAPVVPDASFTIAKTTNLQTTLDAKAPLAGPTFTGVPSGPTAAPGTNTTQFATTAFVGAAITTAATPDASSTVKGKVELATDAEAISGASTVLAITPANLLAVVGDSTEDFVATFNAGLV